MILEILKAQAALEPNTCLARDGGPMPIGQFIIWGLGFRLCREGALPSYPCLPAHTLPVLGFSSDS